jgi:hypothetical protein
MTQPRLSIVTIRRADRASGALFAAALLALAPLGCSSSEGDPAASCSTFCSRVASCTVALCNEDENTSRYGAVQDGLLADCMNNCNEADVKQAAASDPNHFACVQLSTCREFLDLDLCGGGAYYTCGGSTPTASCSTLCARMASCTVALCNEDGHTNQYTALQSEILADCMSSCDDIALQQSVAADPAQWSCYQEHTCRDVFGLDVCGGGGTYACH